MIVGHIGGSSEAVVDTGDIQKSLRFAASRSTYLSRTPSVAGNRTTWTLSVWVKRGKLSDGTLFKTSSGAQYDYFYFDNDTLVYQLNTGAVYSYQTTAVYRDPSAHMHICFVVDTTQAADADRVKIFIGGVLHPRSAGGIPQNTLTYANTNTVPINIGSNSGANNFFDGSLSRVCFVDGAALTPSSFGYQNTEINEWVTKSQSAVKAVVDAGGANSFMLDFDDGTSLTTLGYDKSSKGNNWTLNNHSLTAGVNYDWMDDVPGNSHCTGNPLWTGGSATDPALSAGNLTVSNGAGLTYRRWAGAIAVTSGKWYFEVTRTDAAGLGNYLALGITDASIGALSIGSYGGNPTSSGAASNEWSLTDRGVACNTSTYSNLSGTIGTIDQNDVVQVCVDMDTKKIWFGIQNVISGDPVAGTGAAFSNLPSAIAPLLYVSGSGNNITFAANFGQRPFAYTPPTGFKALSQRNLPAIPAAVLDPTDHHIDITVTKSGDTNFTLPWDASTFDTFFEIKRRDATGDWYQIDGLRGYDKILKSNSTAAETTDANVLGVSGTTCTLKSTLANGTYIISATKAGLSASRQTNTDGSITSTVSRNVDSGFAIVTYTGTGFTATVGHGLGAVPKMVIVKNRISGSNGWPVSHNGIGATDYLVLNATNAKATEATVFAGSHSSTIITLGSNNGVNATSNPMIAYCYADSAIQKSFSYTGNGSADGPYVNLGFECGHSLIKRTDGSSDNWMVMDSARNAYNLTDAYVNPNLSSAEATYGGLDFTATGLKHRTGSTATNVVAGTYIGHAWASVNGKYSNAR